MTKKTESGGEALLGFLTLGSLVANIAQASRNSNLETSHAELQAGAQQLLEQYDVLAARHHQAAQAYALLRDENGRLWHQVQQLHDLLNQAHKANNGFLQTIGDLRRDKAHLEAQLLKAPKEKMA
jgi:uncharacterized phage infection (PIP) family protein YhgE